MMAAHGRRQFAPQRANWAARVRYRIGQFSHGWRAAVTAQDLVLVEQVLSPIGSEAAELFRRMPLDAQAHSLRVAKALRAEGPTSPDLAAAALLHDVGKVAAGDAGAYLGLWMRGPIVLLEAWRPALLARMASPQPAGSPRYALFVHLAHPQIGATWAKDAGCSPLTCWLIAHHQDKYYDDSSPNESFDLTSARNDLARLQWADGRN